MSERPPPDYSTEPRVLTHGTEGDDVIVGSLGDHVIDAGAGNDLVCAGPGVDQVAGGTGDDRLFGGQDGRLPKRGSDWAGDTLVPGPGNDHVDAGEDPRNRFVLFPDTVSYAGSATGIVAHLSSPTGMGAVTGEGSDSIVVPAPGIALDATDYDDVVTGGPGDDQLSLGDGNDAVHGGPGDDRIGLDGAQGHGIDTAVGGPGDDLISSAAGRDSISGGPGDDNLTPGKDGAARVRGGDGDDYLEVVVARRHADPDAFLVDGGDGDDHLQLRVTGPRARALVSVRPGRLVVGGERLLSLPNIESFALDGPLRWRFAGSPRDETVKLASYGKDPFVAHLKGGDDIAVGGYGPDLIDGGPGVDRVRGGPGRLDRCVNVEEVACEFAERRSIDPEQYFFGLGRLSYYAGYVTNRRRQAYGLLPLW